MSNINMVEFKGASQGVQVKPRGDEDNHVIISLLSGSDDAWSFRHSFSSHWLDELIQGLLSARDWIEKNCEPDIKERDNKQYGYKFKE